MEKAKNFTDLIVWQKAHKFVLSVYRLSENFPKSEIYGLTSQLVNCNLIFFKQAFVFYILVSEFCILSSVNNTAGPCRP